MDRALAYSEVYQILKLMGTKYREKIPNKLLEIIVNEMDKDYKPNINIKNPLAEQHLHQRTYDILGMLQLNYWCENEIEKRKLLKKFSDNDKKKEKELYEKYNPNNIFKSDDSNEENEIKQTKELIKYEESTIKKILNKILKFFHIKKY